MKYIEAVEVVNNIKYKEGWKLLVLPAHSGQPWEPGDGDVELKMRWIFSAIDAETLDPNSTQDIVGASRDLPRDVTSVDLVKHAMDLAIETEVHEAREFFRYKGKIIFNPHVSPGGRKRYIVTQAKP